jgi:hypothetical protein
VLHSQHYNANIPNREKFIENVQRIIIDSWRWQWRRGSQVTGRNARWWMARSLFWSSRERFLIVANQALSSTKRTLRSSKRRFDQIHECGQIHKRRFVVEGTQERHWQGTVLLGYGSEVAFVTSGTVSRAYFYAAEARSQECFDDVGVDNIHKNKDEYELHIFM